MYKKKIRFALAMCMLGLCANSAHAHGVMVGGNDFLAGLFHPVTALEDALPIFMLGVLGGQNGLRRCEYIFWLFPVAMVTGALAALAFPGVPVMNVVDILSIVVLGLLVALAKRLPTSILAVLTIFLGLSHGYANGLEAAGQNRAGFFISGAAVAALFLVAYGTALTDFLLRRQATWPSIAVRAAGSWSAAIGLLVLSVSRHSLILA